MRSSRQGEKKTALGFAAIAAAALLLVGCRSTEITRAPSADAVAAALSQAKPAADDAISSGSASATQRNSGGSVTIDVTWENPKDTGGPLTFSVAMNTHSVNLDGYDFGKLAVLRNDAGQEVKPQGWDAPAGDHHRSGSLTFPPSDTSGQPMVGPGTRFLELVIRDVAGVKERVVRWEVPS